MTICKLWCNPTSCLQKEEEGGFCSNTVIPILEVTRDRSQAIPVQKGAQLSH